MENRWYFQLPSFPDNDEWEECAPRDVYYDPATEVAEECPLGTAPEGSVIALNIPFRNRRDPYLILDTFRAPDGKGIVMMVWRDMRRKGVAGTAIAQKDGTWRMRERYERAVWQVWKDKDQKLFGTPLFQKIANSENPRFN